MRMRLFQRKGIYYVEFERGKCRSLRTRNEREAKALFKELKREYLRGRLIQLDEGKRVTLAEFTKEYLDSRIGVSLTTVTKDELSLRLLADVLGGGISLKAIKPKRIEQFKQTCLARGCTPQTVNGYLRHTKAALGVAEEWYRNYSRPKIKFCKTGKRLPRALTPAQIDHLLTEARKNWPRLYPLLVFYLWTGVRRAEALSLQWQYVRLGEKAYARVVGKGDKGRIVPLQPPVVEMLQPIQKDIGPIFVQVHPDTITHWFQKLARKCQIRARLHDLRHSAATYMLASGTPLKVLQKILGHASVTTTEIYAEVLVETLHREMRLEFD